jgi:uncharacterized protein
MNEDLKEAIDSDNAHAIQALLQYGGVDLNHTSLENSLTPLEYASSTGHTIAMKALLDGGVLYHDSLILAVKSKQLRAVQILLENGASIDIRDRLTEFDQWTPLMHAAYLGAIQILKLLLQAGANVESIDTHGRTALILASEAKQNNAITPLLQAGANPNYQDREGNTALTYACRKHHAWIAKKLLENGASKNLVKEFLLMNASRRGAVHDVRKLIEQGAEVNAKYGDTALTIAAAYDYGDVIDELVHSGADLNLRDSTGFTPLIRAATNGRLENVQFLIKAGADQNLVVPEIGWTAIDYARYHEHWEIVRFLESL